MRNIFDLNSNWFFSREKKEVPVSLPDASCEEWEKVDLPHTWNAVDGMIGVPFSRGAYWYVTSFDAPSQPLEEGRTYVEIGACGLRGEVWLNGEKIAEHVGGYSVFRANITGKMKKGKNILAILADNTYSEKVYPQRADFTFYGGLYRYVRLISAPKSGFSLDEYGSDGVYIDTDLLDGGAMVSLRAMLSDPQEGQQVSLEIFDEFDELVSEAWGFAASETKIRAVIPDAHLWDGVEDPFLYRARLRVVDFNDVVDELEIPFGVRTFSVDQEKGFILNGKEKPIRGVCRHQDRLYLGAALSEEMAIEDMEIIAEMGANGVRLAHYQQAKEVYDACDDLGLIVWAEIPYFAQSWDDDAHASSINEIKELVAQNYNHPSICFWGLSNEVLMTDPDQPKAVPCHADLDEAVKSLDGRRLSGIVHEYNVAWDHPLHEIGDVEGWNHYFGWYRGDMEDLAKWADEYHAQYPARRFAVTEYGCDAVLRYHSDAPVKMDYSEEYQVMIHENACETFASRPWIWGTFVWNMFDFGSHFRREGGTKGRNNKGLVSMDRKIRKDSFYVYKAWFSQDPFVHIDGRRYFERPGETTRVKIHSNQPEVTLYADGKPVGTLAGEHTFIFENVPIRKEGTVLTARAGCVGESASAKEGVPADAVMLRGGVEKRDPDPFVFPGFKEASDAKNWFEGVDDIVSTLETKEGFYSINDPVSEVMKSEEAKKVIRACFMAVSERTVPDIVIFGDGDFSLPVSEFVLTGLRGLLLESNKDLALRRMHAALSTIKKD